MNYRRISARFEEWWQWGDAGSANDIGLHVAQLTLGEGGDIFA